MSLFHRNLGPVIQVDERRSLGAKPLEACGIVVLHSFDVFQDQFRVSPKEHLNYPLSILLIFRGTTAVVSSSLGMVVTFAGETRDFPTTRVQRLYPTLF